MGLPFENADYNEDEVGARKIPELTDVVLTNIQNDNVLVYNNGIWENQAQSSSITELNDIPGVTITSVLANQVLKYVGGVWINSTDTDANTDTLNDLTDTLLTTPFGDDEVLKYSGGKWKNGNIPIEKLSNVHISNLQDGETLRYIHANLRWENAYNIDTLNELSDVTISSNLNNHVLKYNHTSGVYKNAYLNLTDLGDTNITTLANGNTLIYNNGEWSAGNVSLSTFTNGTGISVTGTSPDFTITNTSPDREVTFNNGTGISVTGDYPTFTITNTYQETDPIYSLSDAANVTTAKMNQWQAAYGWGDHAGQNYIKNIAPLHVDIPNLKVGINQASPSVDFQVGTTMYVNNTSGKVGIGIAVPTTQLEVDGSIQIDSAVEARLKFHYSGSSAHALSEITAEQDGTNGGDLQFYTKIDGGNVTEKLRINNVGAIGLGATPDYGTAGQFLKTGGSGSAVSWDTPTNTTYSATGTGLSLNGTVFQNTKPDETVVLTNGTNINVTGSYPSFTINSTDTNTTYTNGSNMSLVGTEFNIPQSVATSASPSFTALTLGNTGTNQGVINLQDVTNTGRDTVANIKGFKEGTNGGDLQFFTKVDGGNVTEKLRINNVGKLGIRGNYGTANQYLKNNASGLPEWTTVTSVSQAPLDTPVIATPSGTGNLTLTSGTGLNTLLTYTPPLVNTLPYFIFHKSSSQTIPNSGGAVDNVDITWDGLFTASPLTAAAFAGGPTLFKVGVAGMYHLDINAEIGGTGAAKLELNVYIDGVLKNQSIINVYDAQSSTTSGDNVRETSLSCSFLKSLTTTNVITIEARAILLVAGTTMVVVAGSTTNRTQVSGFRIGPG